MIIGKEPQNGIETETYHHTIEPKYVRSWPTSHAAPRFTPSTHTHYSIIVSTLTTISDAPTGGVTAVSTMSDAPADGVAVVSTMSDAHA